MSKNKQAITIEEALKTAIKFEQKVRDVYTNAVEESKDETGRNVFGILAKEEQGHIDYLNHRLDELHSTGDISIADIATILPSKEVIDEQVAQLKKTLEPQKKDYELKLLQKAVDVEQQTSNFYKKMTEEMDGNAQEMFAAFLEIEDGHLAIVQAELDAVSGTGFFFGFEEFNMEAG
jgi:rubrerythrin